MYGKIFEQMYDGSLAYGEWEALVTFQQLIILADADGIVDMTPIAISRRTSIPLDIIEKGIKALMEPDPHSRSKQEDGRRVVCIDPERGWGYWLVNYEHYVKLANSAERREQNRLAKQRARAMSADVSTCQQTSAMSAHIDIDRDINKSKALSGKPDLAKTILSFLNEKTGKNFRPVKANLDLIIARLNEGYEEDQFRQVIAMLTRKWSKDENMISYLRPKTLFNRTNFANYVGELV